MRKKNMIIMAFLALVVIAGVVLFLLTVDRSKYYTVTFDSNGGTSVKSVKVKANAIIKLKTNIKKEGYTFTAWLEDDIVVSNDYKVTKNVKLTASWKSINAEKITIKFETSGGEEIKDIFIDSGGVLHLPNNPTKDGYIFGGWKDQNGNPVYDKMIVKEPLKIIAIWENKNGTGNGSSTGENTGGNTGGTGSGGQGSTGGNEGSSGNGGSGSSSTSVTYYCEPGYVLSGNKCSKTETINYTISDTYTCPEGTTKSPTNDKKCILEVQTRIASLCDNEAISSYVKNNERYCVYDEIYVAIKDNKGVDLPVSERDAFCKEELGEDGKYKGVDETNKLFLCETSNTTTSKNPKDVCGQDEKYRLLADGVGFVCYTENLVDGEATKQYCPSGYVKNSCSNTSCSCSRTITVLAKEK